MWFLVVGITTAMAKVIPDMLTKIMDKSDCRMDMCCVSKGDPLARVRIVSFVCKTIL